MEKKKVLVKTSFAYDQAVIYPHNILNCDPSRNINDTKRNGKLSSFSLPLDDILFPNMWSVNIFLNDWFRSSYPRNHKDWEKKKQQFIATSQKKSKSTPRSRNPLRLGL